MIECKEGLFHLKNHALSCLLRVNRYGLLEQVHFGAPVRSEDVEALASQPGLGWGSSLLLNDKDPGSCPDVMALAWSGSGRGDFRESPLEMDGAATNFTYVNHSVLKQTPTMESGLPQTHGEGETLEIIMEQRGARLKLYFTLYETAMTRFAVLENTGDVPVQLQKLMSFSMDLYGSFTMTAFNGGWIAEMQRCDTNVGMSRVVNESATGASSNQHNPGFLLSEADTTEDAGRAFGFNLIYSGNHYASARCSQQGFTRVMQGINPANFCKELQPGEKFETPEAVLCYSGAGFNGLSRRMHRFVMDHVVPVYWRSKERPILYNSWEGCMFDFNQSRLIDLAHRAKNWVVSCLCWMTAGSETAITIWQVWVIITSI